MSRPIRVTFRQKTRMLKFMKTHTQLATGRLNCPDGTLRRQQLLNELASVLNAVEDGAYKSPDRWYKTWQDWKSDIKAKARKIKNHQGGSEKDPPPLIPLEQEVLDFINPMAVDSFEVPDPLQVTKRRKQLLAHVQGVNSETVVKNQRVLNVNNVLVHEFKTALEPLSLLDYRTNQVIQPVMSYLTKLGKHS